MSILIERGLTCEMRDGCGLSVNVFRPADEGRYPALVFRTPYDKNAIATMSMALDPLKMVEAGYVVVQQDVRGRGASEGDFEPRINEFDDGYDTVEWAAKQPWCDGQVGAYGISYHGSAAWSAAASRPPSLRAIAAAQAGSNHQQNYWAGGAFALGFFASWVLRLLTPGQMRRAALPPEEKQRRLHEFVDLFDDFEAVLRTTPLRNLPVAQRHTALIAYAYENLDHPGDDAYQRSLSFTQHHRDVTTPCLITAGWLDSQLPGDLEHYRLIRAEGGSREAREESRLVIGPWMHGPGLHSASAGELDFGARASGLSMDLKEDLTAYHRRWFDYWLKGAPLHGFAPVRIFVMGENRWRDEQEWPLARQALTEWRLQPDGGFNTAQPPVGAPPRAYPHDPNNPCPTVGGASAFSPQYSKGPVAQNVLFARPDVLNFTSEPLAEPLEVTGLVTATIWASTTARDADWVVKLCDVHPDGRSYNLCEGIIRASLRESDWTEPHPVEPNEVVRYEIDLLATSMLFPAGHRLQVIVTSSNFPRYDRNPGTGEFSLDAEVFQAATHRIYCDAEHPSHLTLPIIRRI